MESQQAQRIPGRVRALHGWAGRPTGPPRDILTGFLAPDERESYGRPVGVAIGPDGSLLVADDVGRCDLARHKRVAAYILGIYDIHPTQIPYAQRFN